VKNMQDGHGESATVMAWLCVSMVDTEIVSVCVCVCVCVYRGFGVQWGDDDVKCGESECRLRHPACAYSSNRPAALGAISTDILSLPGRDI
jgi:hypothetical protein